MAEERTTGKATDTGGQRGSTTPTVRWDDSQVRTSYANACNVASTREEVVLFFGINQGMHGEEILVQLGDRIMLNPYAAKRLNLLLTNVLRQHESRFGTLDVDVRRPAEQKETLTS